MREGSYDPIHDLADFLVGTANSLQQALSAFGIENDLSEDEQSRLDDLVFLCDECGWWSSTDEMNTDQETPMCLECSGD